LQKSSFSAGFSRKKSPMYKSYLKRRRHDSINGSFQSSSRRSSIRSSPFKKSSGKKRIVNSNVKHKILDVLKNPKLHQPFVSDIENKASEKSCKTHDPCFVASGTYANAYKTCENKTCLLFKVKKEGRTFDINEYTINLNGYKKLKKNQKIPLIAQPFGVLGSSKNPLAYIYAYEDNSVVLGDFLDKVNFSEADFKAIIFQIASSLFYLQKGLPGFTHNDLHTDNILVITHSKAETFHYKKLSFQSKYSIRIIDFGQASTNTHKTKDAIGIWGATLGNTMVDFLRVSNWILLRLYKKLRNTKSAQLKSSCSNFLILLSEYVSKDCVKNGGHSRDNSLTGKYLSTPWLSINKLGVNYINSLYAIKHKNAMEQVLQSGYFLK